MEFPFYEKEIGDKIFVRQFNEDVNPSELVWHQDREDRVVKVVNPGGWKLQIDNELPLLLEQGHSYTIPAYVFHRVIKGHGKLVIEVEKKT